MKKKMKSSSGRLPRALLSGAGLAFLTGGVAEAFLNTEAYIYSDAIDQTFAAPNGVGATLNIGFILGTDFQFRTTVLPNNKSLAGTVPGVVSFFGNGITSGYLPGDRRTTGGDLIGLVLRLRDWTAGTLIDFRFGAVAHAEVMAPMVVPHSANDLNFDDWIGVGGVNGFNLDGAVVRLPVSNPPPFTSPGYVGFALKDNAAGSIVHYGWLEITDIDLSGIASITIGSYGIKTAANSGIHAGDTGSAAHNNAVATPEPATTGLALLALGAAGVMRHRRRRETVA